jgi:hypothetical protein
LKNPYAQPLTEKKLEDRAVALVQAFRDRDTMGIKGALLRLSNDNKESVSKRAQYLLKKEKQS